MIVVFADEFREIGGAPRLLVLGTLESFFGIGESLRADKDAGTRTPVFLSFFSNSRAYCVDLPPPEPVLLMDSPPVFSDVLPGTGDRALDLETPTFRIWARTWESWRS